MERAKKVAKILFVVALVLNCAVIVDQSANQEPEKPEQIARAIILRGVDFYERTDQLYGNWKDALNKVGKSISAYPNEKYAISSHVMICNDSVECLNLSMKRAKALRNYLISIGVDSLRITSQGYGSQRPISSLNTYDGKKMSERIEIAPIQ